MSEVQATLYRMPMTQNYTSTVHNFRFGGVTYVGSSKVAAVVYRMKYNPKMVRKLLRLKKEGPIVMFDDAKEALEWLNRPEK
jgi:hypothetical protein